MVDQDDDLIDVDTGGGFNKNLRGGLHQTLNNLARQKPSMFGNLSSDDRAALEGVISKHARNLPTGSSFSLSTRTAMKREIQALKDSGRLSALDVKDAHDIIDDL